MNQEHDITHKDIKKLKCHDLLFSQGQRCKWTTVFSQILVRSFMIFSKKKMKEKKQMEGMHIVQLILNSIMLSQYPKIIKRCIYLLFVLYLFRKVAQDWVHVSTLSRMD